MQNTDIPSASYKAMKLPEPKYIVSEDNHKYSIVLPTGETIGPLKSVTSILKVLDKPALIGWAAREASGYFKTELLRLGSRALTPETLDQIAKDAAGAHRRKAKDAADLGTACHNIFEAIIQNREPAEIPSELTEPAAAFKMYRLQSDIEVVATEVAVASAKHRFGGRLDFLGYSKTRGGWGIGDYKTSGAIYSEHGLQVGGYAAAVEEMYDIKIAWSEIVRFSKKAPYESEARPVTNISAAMAGFLSALNMMRANEVKLIGEQIFTSAGKPQTVPTPAKQKKKPAGPLGF